MNNYKVECYVYHKDGENYDRKKADQYSELRVFTRFYDAVDFVREAIKNSISKGCRHSNEKEVICDPNMLMMAGTIYEYTYEDKTNNDLLVAYTVREVY